MISEVDEYWIVDNGKYVLKISKTTASVRSVKLHGSDLELKAEYDYHNLFYPEFQYLYAPDLTGQSFNQYSYDADVSISVSCNTDKYAVMNVDMITGYLDIFWDMKFIKNTPYIIVTTLRKTERSFVYTNAQQCAMFTMEMDDSYIITYNNEILQTMDDGTRILMEGESSVTVQHSMFTAIDQGLGSRFPAIVWYERDNDITAGIIVTDVSSNQRKTISYHGGGRSTHGYSEAQWNYFGRADDESIYLKQGTSYGMEMYYYLDFGSVDSFFQFSDNLINDEYFDLLYLDEEKPLYLRGESISTEPRYFSASWGGRINAAPQYEWGFPEAGNDWINTTELFRHRAISIPSSSNGRRDCHLVDYKVMGCNDQSCFELTSTDPTKHSGVAIEDYGSEMKGSVKWKLNSLDNILTYSLKQNSDRLYIEGRLRPSETITLKELYIELDYSSRVSEVEKIGENSWDIRADDDVYGVIGIVLTEPVGTVDIVRTDSTIVMYLVRNSAERNYYTWHSWEYQMELVPHTGYPVNSESEIPGFPGTPENETYRKYYKMLPGFESAQFGYEPNWNILLYDANPGIVDGMVAEISFFAEPGNYPVKFYSADEEITGIVLNGKELSQTNWEYHEGTGVLTILTDWRDDASVLLFTGSRISESGKNKIVSPYPNPFDESIMIRLEIEEPEEISIKIYDICGKLVKTLLNDEFFIGRKTLTWNGRNNAGMIVGSGVYYCVLVSDNRIIDTGTLICLR